MLLYLSAFVFKSCAAPLPYTENNYKCLQLQVNELLEQKTNSDKLIAMLEFNNQHNKDKVKNMEVSNKLLSDKIYELQQQLESKDQSEVEQKLLSKIKELDARITEQKRDLSNELHKQYNEYEHKLSSQKEELECRYQSELKYLKEQVQGLEEIKAGYTKQIHQIEENNSAMHIKLGSVQKNRYDAEKQLNQLTHEHQNLDQQKKESEEKFSKEKTDLETKLKETEKIKENLEKNTKENASKILDLNERLLELTQSSDDLKHKLKEANEAKDELSKDFIEARQSKYNLIEELNKVKLSNEKLLSELETSSSQNEKISRELSKQERSCGELRRELESVSAAGEEDTRNKVNDLNKEIEILKERQSKENEERIELLEEQLRFKEQEMVNKFAEVKQSSQQEYEKQLKSLSADYMTLNNDNSASVDSNTANDEKDYSGVLHEAECLIKHVESVWRDKIKHLLSNKEKELSKQMDHLQKDWNKERKELERLTGVAAAAFRSGTDSVELLKSQVIKQKQEIDIVKHQHQLEVSELKTLLEVKHRRKRNVSSEGFRLATSLEDAAEFEYLKNVLYQFMLGKETSTLSKVLCAVVKFDQQQQQEIAAAQQQIATLLINEENSIEKSE